jgi:hypothetical protein
MTARRLAVLVLLVVILAGCGASDDAGSQAASTTTTSTTTTTTAPDPAVAGCKLWERGEFYEAANELLASRDERIVEAVKAWDAADTLDQTDLGAVVRAATEVRYACRAAGYLPR